MPITTTKMTISESGVYTDWFTVPSAGHMAWAASGHMQSEVTIQRSFNGVDVVGEEKIAHKQGGHSNDAPGVMYRIGVAAGELRGGEVVTVEIGG